MHRAGEHARGEDMVEGGGYGQGCDMGGAGYVHRGGEHGQGRGTWTEEGGHGQGWEHGRGGTRTGQGMCTAQEWGTWAGVGDMDRGEGHGQRGTWAGVGERNGGRWTLTGRQDTGGERNGREEQRGKAWG